MSLKLVEEFSEAGEWVPSRSAFSCACCRESKRLMCKFDESVLSNTPFLSACYPVRQRTAPDLLVQLERATARRFLGDVLAPSSTQLPGGANLTYPK